MRHNPVKQKLQTGADSAALAIAQDCARSACGQVGQTAQNLASANFPGGQALGAVTDPALTATSGKVTVRTSTVSKHLFAPILGIGAASLIFLSAYGGMISLAQTGLMGIAGYALANMVTQRVPGGETKGLLLQLANECKLKDAIAAMFRGELINETEHRAVLHTALRQPNGAQVFTEGVDVMPEVRQVLEQMKGFHCYT